MANPAADVRAKAQAKWDGATVVDRKRNSITHQHPTNPNRFMFDSSIGPLHYGVSEDQEIDTAWVADTTDGYTHAMTANDFTTRVRADQFNAGDIFRFEADGEWLVFDPQSINWIDENTSRQQIAIKQNVAGAFDDYIVKFADAYGTGIDFEYHNHTSQLQKYIVIDQFSTLPAPTVQGNDIWFEAEFSMSLSSGINFWLDGVEWARANAVRVQTANMIEVRNSAGTEVLWWLGYPRAYDSSGTNETIGQLEVRRQGGPSSLFITVRIPYEWMAAAEYPVRIDPTVDYQTSADADDAREAAGSVNTASDSVVDATSEYYGNRWTGVTIPDGATVDAMTIDFYLVNPNADEPQHLCWFEDGSSPATFTDGTGDPLSNRTATTTSVTLGDGSGLGSDGTHWWSDLATLPELKTIGQELVNSYDYSSGLAMVAIVQGGADASDDLQRRDYTNGSSLAGKLHIEYTAAGGTANPWHIYAQQ